MDGKWRARAWACAWMALACTAQAATGTQLPKQDWTYEAVSASPSWIDFTRHLRQSYVRPVPDDFAARTCQELVDRVRTIPDRDWTGADPVGACITEVLKRLDPVSQYLDPAETTRQRTPSSFVGIGLELGMGKPGEGVRVVKPLEGGPADRGGLRAGDLVIEVDGKDLRPLGMGDAVKTLRGQVGTMVRLKVARAGTAEPLDFAITRAEVLAMQVRGRRLPQGPAYLRIRLFTDAAAAQFREQVEHLLAEGGPPSGLILDLRSNSGGTLKAVLRIASAFAPEGTPLVKLVERGGVHVQASADALPAAAYPDAFKARLAGLPIVVLVDRGTAAGSELLAQFLREYRHAVLLGRPTLGYAHLESVLGVGPDAMVRMATAEMVSPAGVHWAGQGLQPDEVFDESVMAGRVEFGDEGDAGLPRAIQRLGQPGFSRPDAAAAPSAR